ncbi:hypothetical protein ACFQY7_34440 [Actinomadura luteofluorescens]|uniref:DUF5655 domain-containing protein n=1 Tax=Actinomadura luteofluorescens TaxID=46163 RepID=A0A7Y9JHK1_9ACTN|nr:hypothetical protein [Actinomadura luteofluorescens]NYD49135.1 hypothetical protein [Actinomadura luteofluorescens]
MGEVLSAQVERSVLYLRTRLGRRTACRYLEVLALTLRPQGWRFVKLYRPAAVPLLRVYVNGTEEIAIEVSALPVPGGEWAYHDARLGRRGYLHPCTDADAAAKVVGDLLKHRMFPSTW